jgi:hypothetical protein
MSHHAPRGPIKRKGSADPSTPPPMEGRCTAHSGRTGAPCKKWAIKGGTVCQTHGGGAPQVKQAAMARLRALQEPAIDALDWLLKERSFPSATMSAIRDVLDRTEGKAPESMDLHVSGAVDVVSVLTQRQARRLESQNP